MIDKILRYKKYIIGILIIVGLIILDQVTKQLAIKHLKNAPEKELIKGLINLTFVLNPGAAWGILKGQTVFFAFVTLIALTIFGYLFISIDFNKKIFYTFAMIFIIAGTIGNFIDRMFYPDKKVVDMIQFAFFTNFPVFNLADTFLTVGVVLFGIDVIFLEKKRENENKNNL